MKLNVILEHQLIVLLFLAGSISNAQEIEDIRANHNENKLSEVNLIGATDQKPTGCFEYSGYVVSRKTGDPIANVSVEVKNTVNGLVSTIKTDQTGYYKFVIPCNEKSKIVFYGKGYSKELRIVKTGENLKLPSRNNRIYLTPFDSLVENDGRVEKIKVDPIFFDSDESTIAWDKMTIDKVLFTMFKFPEIRIKIEFNSNEGGTDISNAVLSYFRAKSARRYLILQGIDADRIESANGYGLGGLENDCENGIDDDQESSDSARSDFIIVSN